MASKILSFKRELPLPGAIYFSLCGYLAQKRGCVEGIDGDDLDFLGLQFGRFILDFLFRPAVAT